MATLPVTHPTLLDVVKRTDPDGSIALIAELMHETNEVLDDMVFVQGNLPTGHRTTIRTGLPEPTWRKLYGGVQPSKSTTVQVTDTIGDLEAYAEVDKRLADLNGNTEAFRISEDAAHIEGMNQEMAETVFYGSEELAPEEFTGFAPRFNDAVNAANKTQIINGGGTTNLTSVWLIVWGENSVHGIYGKGGTAGLSMKDLGEVTVENVDGAGGRAQMYRTHYKWECGLCVRDWRQVVRIANIDVAALAGDDNTAIDAQKKLIRLMIKASERVHQLRAGRPAFYVNRRIREALRLGILEKISANLTWETVAGRRVMTFDDIPVRRVDALHANETQVAFSS